MKYCRLSSLAIPAVAGSRSRGDMMISVRPPVSSVMARRAPTCRRSDEDLPGLDVGALDDGADGTAFAPGNADGAGGEFRFEGAGAEYDEAFPPDPSMPIA